MAQAKAFLRAVLPPVIVSAILRLRRRLRTPQPTWEYVPEAWVRQQLDPHIGWNVASVDDRHRAIWDRWLPVASGTGALGIDF
jgi:hypothetical protein